MGDSAHPGLMIAFHPGTHPLENEGTEDGDLDDHPLKDLAGEVLEAVHGSHEAIPKDVDHNHVAHALHNFIRESKKMQG